MKNKLYKWQRIGLWFAGISYFLTIIYYGDLREKNLDLTQISVHIMSIVFVLVIFWLLFKLGNIIYLKIKKRKEENK